MRRRSNEISDHVNNEIVGKPTQVSLDRMRNTMAVPIIIDFEAPLFVTSANVFGENVSNMGVLRERDVAAFIQHKSFVVAKRPSVPTIIGVFVIAYKGNVRGF